MPFTFALLIVYSAALIAIGSWFGRRVRGTGDFFVAGRDLTAPLLFSTVLASNIGAGTTINATAIGYAHGLSAWWWDGSAGIGTLVLAGWVGPRIWREARTHGDLTVGDFLERHYGREMRALVGVLIWCGTWAVLSAQLMGIASVFEAAGGIPRPIGAAAGAGVAVAYFIGGGLLSSASVNRVQLAVILAGFAVATPAAIAAAGGWPAVAAGDATRLNPFGSGTHPGWRYVFVLAPAFIVSPGLLQKTYGARDETAVRRGLAWAGAIMLVFACAPPLLGMAAAVLYPDLGTTRDADLALGTLFAGALPPAFGALALAAVFSAEVSTADAVLFMLSTAAARDLYAGFINPRASEAAIVRVARGAAIAGAGCGLALSLWFDTILAALSVFYSLLTVVLFVPVVAGLYVRGTVRAEGLGAVLAGLPALIAVHLATRGAGYGILTPTLAGVLAGAAAFALVRAVRPTNS